MPGDNGSLWAPILEKAFAKVKGSYANANGGFTATGIRALTGVPTMDYWFDELGWVESDYPATWELLNAADTLDYILGAGTFGVDSDRNDCGIVAGHAYAVISAFTLTDSDGTVMH